MNSIPHVQIDDLKLNQDKERLRKVGIFVKWRGGILDS